MKETVMKTNLQFFAETTEPNSDPTPTPAPEPKPEDNNQEPEITSEERLQQLMVENAKLKKSFDKASSEAADYKKKYNSTLSDVEKASQEKAEKEAEREEEFSKLLRESKVNKLAKNFMELGYPADKATEAAEAQHDGDTDALFKIQSEVQQTLLKQKEAEWLKSRPPVNTGAGDGSGDDPFLKGFNS